MRETNRHPLQKCARPFSAGGQQRGDNYFQVTYSIILCANSRRRQANVPWALARPRAHISREAFPVPVV